MLEKYKNLIEYAKEKGGFGLKTLIFGSVLLALGFWGIVFPRYLFTDDCVRIVDEEGRDVTEDESEEKNLYYEISSAEPDRLEIKISILEWAER
mgnify:FL=1